jgi:hypothetical protein
MRYKTIFLLIIISIFPTMSLADAPAPEPDPEAMDAILYRGGYASRLLDLNGENSSMFLAVDSSGTGYLADYDSKTKGENWRKIELKSQKNWQSLTRTSATELWGAPQERYAYRQFLTWDIFGTYNRERNLYHLDLEFDPRKNLNGYRVRGIGIGAPRWIFRDGHSSEE